MTAYCMYEERTHHTQVSLGEYIYIVVSMKTATQSLATHPCSRFNNITISDKNMLNERKKKMTTRKQLYK